MALQKVFVTADVALAERFAVNELHFVYEEHRLAVRQDLFDLFLVHLTYSFPRKNPGDAHFFGGAPGAFHLK